MFWSHQPWVIWGLSWFCVPFWQEQIYRPTRGPKFSEETKIVCGFLHLEVNRQDLAHFETEELTFTTKWLVSLRYLSHSLSNGLGSMAIRRHSHLHLERRMIYWITAKTSWMSYLCLSHDPPLISACGTLCRRKLRLCKTISNWLILIPNQQAEYFLEWWVISFLLELWHQTVTLTFRLIDSVEFQSYLYLVN